MVKNSLENTYNPALQISLMKRHFPDFEVTRKSDKVIFEGTLLVKPELPLYKVRVVYSKHNRPRVYILEPELDALCPHLYRNDETGKKPLCLYHPDNYKWSNNIPLTRAIMPWTVAWIYFYEYWLQTGEWVGPEVPHNGIEKNIENEQRYFAT